MQTSSRSVSSQIVKAPSVLSSASCPSVSSENANHRLVPVQVFIGGHKDQVNCMCFYPDENKLVSGSHDKTLGIWDRMTGVVQVWNGHTDAVLAVDVSRDGKMIVSGSLDQTVRIWNGESGETTHVFEGHGGVWSVQFSQDSNRVVSGSSDRTVRVWSLETGKLAFEPIKCHEVVWCVCYSPSGDRIASGANSVQIWGAETGRGILSLRNSHITSSLVWTANGTHLIGGGDGNVTIWNSHNGEQLRTWKAHYDTTGGTALTTLSLSPTGTHLATSNWNEKTAPIFDILTGKQVAAFEHDQKSNGIAYSPSGKFISTGCDDNKVYVWEAPAFKDPQSKSREPSFSSFLDKSAIPVAGPSRNDGMDHFWDSQLNIHHPGTHRNQQPSLPPQHVFDKVRNTFANFFIHRPAVATQTNPVRETVEVVEVAAGKDRPYAATIDPPKFNRVQKILYAIIHCRKPEEEDEEVSATTAAHSSQAVAGNAAKCNQPEHKVNGTELPGGGPDSSSTPADNSVICTQPERTSPMSLTSTENPAAERDSSPTSPANSEKCNEPGSTEMVDMHPTSVTPAIPETLTVMEYVSPVCTPSTDPLSPAVASCKPSSSTNARPTFPQLSLSQYINLSSANTLSPEESAIIEDYRRLKGKSAGVRMVAEPLGSLSHDRKSPVYYGLSTSPSQPHPSAMQSTSSTPPHHPPSHVNVSPSHSSVTLDPLLNVAPGWLSTSSLSASPRLPHSPHPAFNRDVPIKESPT
ncbi:hypothetical protein PAXINDRAFT_101229 [Paxillus involutus ATCC 200175]|uniref:WD40 repeat-like protein n=1 Tax=Paxillus involutus ATCC 200175 TaxID=664439 RepID=A0A0C9T9V6_PAXIN|nr:hypothetical protein PAXINDRAFT_101229 [Paxillus involutus ATCC 200175]